MRISLKLAVGTIQYIWFESEDLIYFAENVPSFFLRIYPKDIHKYESIYLSI